MGKPQFGCVRIELKRVTDLAVIFKPNRPHQRTQGIRLVTKRAIQLLAICQCWYRGSKVESMVELQSILVAEIRTDGTKFRVVEGEAVNHFRKPAGWMRFRESSGSDPGSLRGSRRHQGGIRVT
jgi:hypothetical protein